MFEFLETKVRFSHRVEKFKVNQLNAVMNPAPREILVSRLFCYWYHGLKVVSLGLDYYTDILLVRYTSTISRYMNPGNEVPVGHAASRTNSSSSWELTYLHELFTLK